MKISVDIDNSKSQDFHMILCAVSDNHKKENKVVLVFSNLGISRSATIVIAYIMKTNKCSLKVSILGSEVTTFFIQLSMKLILLMNF